MSDAARALVALLYRPARRTGLILPEMALNSDKAYQTREQIDDFSSIQTGLTNEQGVGTAFVVKR